MSVSLAEPSGSPAARTVPNVRLSRRELEVLTLIAQGHDSNSAADSLFVSKRTVDYHLASVYTKLNLHRRLHAIHRAATLGLVPFEPTSLFPDTVQDADASHNLTGLVG